MLFEQMRVYTMVAEVCFIENTRVLKSNANVLINLYNVNSCLKCYML